ncbi:hypothetical protein SERLADRAFT_379023 [Serpula lacrymans var. lacrymans S7.9]|uniref:Uncharacterized protein n=1 Tax=Serpula lacrymans var. lacrymans (strain S7.9) TaxID=578457 RepID=F8NHY7_SERL9|nr:uncharacterized protein SERLADRAFT_379023 [Serpula lacrymans var. lacrymans S7.9]EGO29709.1 hypothetical protein SERLADRAFT_379023 [Serpula lacrymans var. lacrymans S7.9]
MSGVGSGTQSPPLEATGEEVPMGVSSIDQEEPVQHVKDADQRKDYFDNSVSDNCKDCVALGISP